jgi:ABC-2 type transport system permease protein
MSQVTATTTLSRLIKSEFRKALYSRTNYGLLLGAIALVVLSSFASPYAISRASTAAYLKTPGLESATTVDALFGKALAGYVFVLIMAIISMTSEFKNHTAVATFLVSPKRSLVMIAKMAVGAVVGVIYMLVSTAAGFAAIHIALGLYKNVATADSSVYGNALLAAVVLGAVLAILGVAVGTFVRSQTLAVTGAIIWLMVIEPLLLLFWDGANKFLISGLLTSMMAIKLDVKSSVGVSIDTSKYLEPIPAALVMVAYGLLFGFIAIMTSGRRDIE